MSISVNGQSCVPPGFRFHPTEEELLNYYLRKKVAAEKIDLDVIRDVDLNKLEPWDIQEKCRIGSTPQNDWYFFSHKDKKYPTGTRTNRATAAGFWKATGRDKIIHTSCRRIGMRKTLVFYKGRAPHGQKSDWIMHEYRLDDHSDLLNPHSNFMSCMEDTGTSQEEGWVVCRVFKKKNHPKCLANSPNIFSSSVNSTGKNHVLLHSASDGALEQILQQMGRSCKQESEAINKFSSNLSCGRPINEDTQNRRCLRPIESSAVSNGVAFHERFMKLPALESPTLYSQLLAKNYALPAAPTFDGTRGNVQNQEPDSIHAVVNLDDAAGHATDQEPGAADWAAIDHLLAAQLDGQAEHMTHLQCFEDAASCFAFCSTTKPLNASDYENGGGCDDGDLWSLTRSASSAPATDHMGRASM